MSSATWRCGQPLHSRGHHRGACATTGVLGRRGYSLESCKGCPSRLEVVAGGLPLFHGAQLAVDTTMVSTVQANGALRRQCAERDGAALDQARRTKERTFPELTGEHGRARLAVLACETGGRWSEESHTRSSDSWPERGPGRSPVKCEPQQEGHGSGGGALLWRVAPLRRSRSPCWSVEEVWGLMGRSRRPLTSSGMSRGPSSELSAHGFWG